MKLLRLGLLIFTAGLTALQADVIQVDLTSPSQTGSPGDVLQFFGTITNLSATDTVFLNGIGATSVSPDLTIDPTPFFFNRPPSLGPGETSTLFEIFDIIIAPGALAGPYVGNTVSFQGGLDSSSFEPLADTNADVIVASATVPEPSPATLLVAGLAALGVCRKWRQFAPRTRVLKAQFAPLWKSFSRQHV